jgi:hypothetical protein
VDNLKLSGVYNSVVLTAQCRSNRIQAAMADTSAKTL